MFKIESFQVHEGGRCSMLNNQWSLINVESKMHHYDSDLTFLAQLSQQNRFASIIEVSENLFIESWVYNILNLVFSGNELVMREELPQFNLTSWNWIFSTQRIPNFFQEQ